VWREFDSRRIYQRGCDDLIAHAFLWAIHVLRVEGFRLKNYLLQGLRQSVGKCKGLCLKRQTSDFWKCRPKLLIERQLFAYPSVELFLDEQKEENGRCRVDPFFLRGSSRGNYRQAS
jgi:hypothetical protein